MSTRPRLPTSTCSVPYVPSREGGSRAVGCSHRYSILTCPVRLTWPDGEDVNPPLRLATCTCCKKQWALDLTRRQRLRLISYRRPHDRRSPYELAPEVLVEH